MKGRLMIPAIILLSMSCFLVGFVIGRKDFGSRTESKLAQERQQTIEARQLYINTLTMNMLLHRRMLNQLWEGKHEALEGQLSLAMYGDYSAFTGLEEADFAGIEMPTFIDEMLPKFRSTAEQAATNLVQLPGRLPQLEQLLEEARETETRRNNQ